MAFLRGGIQRKVRILLDIIDQRRKAVRMDYSISL